MPIVSCRICSKSFDIKPSHQKLGWGKYCSTICRAKGQLKGKDFFCEICNKEFYRSPSKIKHSKGGHFFCSKSCQIIWRNSFFSGEKHPNWTGGITIYREILQRSQREQRCVSCGSMDKRVLIAHHIDHNRKNNDLENLIWVCLNCHHLIHHFKEVEMSLKSKL